MLLDENRALFESLVNQAATFFNVNREYIEKDYWLIKLLKHIFSKSDGYVFKGGTSLSKCYKLINRFSEDIDISYSTPYSEARITEIERKFKGITKSVKEIGLEILNKDKLRRSSYFNQFLCPYPSLFSDNSITKMIVIELAAQTPSFPTIETPIQSFVGEFLHMTKNDDIVAAYQLEPFNIRAQSLERTLVDKTFAICDYYISGKCAKHSRHIYDINKILSAINLNESLLELFNQVRAYRQQNQVCYSAKKGIKLSNLIEAIVEDKVFKNDYETITYELLYDKCTYDECIEKIKGYIEFLKKIDI